MFAKNSIFVLCILLFGFVLLSGCVAPGTEEGSNLGTVQSNLSSTGSGTGTVNSPNNGGPSEVDNIIPIDNPPPPGEDPPEKQPDSGDATPDYSNATPQQLLDALGLAQLLGLPSDALDAAAKEKIKQWAEGIINSPNSNNAMLVEALQVLQALGLDPEGMFQKEVWAKIKVRVEGELNDPNTCKNRLKEIAELFSQLGWKDLADEALKKAETAGDMCSKIIYEYLSEAQDTYYSTKVTIIGNTLKRYEVYGITLGMYNYYFETGKFMWEVKEVVDTGCVILTREGKGEYPITENIKHSLFGFDANSDHYSGSSYYNVEINIDKQPSPTRNEYCDEIPDQQLGKSKEFRQLPVGVEGNAKGNRLVGQKSQVWGPPTDSESGFEYTYWDLSIGER